MKTVFFSIILLILSSCTEINKNKITDLVQEWNYKEILFPKNLIFTSQGKDTVDFSLSNAEYKIINYVDSIECFSCRLQLNKWQELITMMDSLTLKEIAFGFFLQAKTVSELQDITQKYNFKYPICFDEKGEFNYLNHFPKQEGFQTFLLNKNNKVIAIGNPIHSPRIKSLYLSLISKKTNNQETDQIQTKAKTSASNINFGRFHWEEKQDTTVTLVNTGHKLLVIHDITTSCGCTVVTYDKRPVMPKDSIKVNITYKADYPGHFNKTIGIYCNTPESPIVVRVKGQAIKQILNGSTAQLIRRKNSLVNNFRSTK